MPPASGVKPAAVGCRENRQTRDGWGLGAHRPLLGGAPRRRRQFRPGPKIAQRHLVTASSGEFYADRDRRALLQPTRIVQTIGKIRQRRALRQLEGKRATSEDRCNTAGLRPVVTDVLNGLLAMTGEERDRRLRS
jgi:hypothetical protein